MSYKLALHSLH